MAAQLPARALTALALAALPGAACGATPREAERWRPRPDATPWQIQLQGTPNLRPRARVYELDGERTSAAVVRRLHRRGARVICYLNAGAWESFRADSGDFPRSLLGRVYAGYPDERWLDIRRIDALAPLIEARLETCRRKGFDGADPDNVDGYGAHSGFALSAAHQLRYNRWLARAIRRRGMAALLKNDAAQVRSLVRSFDGAVVEECFARAECHRFSPFVRARKAVYAIEYRRPSRKVCRQARRLRFSVVFMRRSLSGSRRTC